MRYWVTDCITGVWGEEELGAEAACHSLEEAKAERQHLIETSGHGADFWIIVDDEGNQIDLGKDE